MASQVFVPKSTRVALTPLFRALASRARSLLKALPQVPLILAPLVLVACAGAEPAPLPPAGDDIATGPGLLTGKEGAFVYRRGGEKDAEAEQQDSQQTAKAQGTPPTVGQNAGRNAGQNMDIIERQSRMLDRQSQMLDRQGRELERLENQVEQLKQELEALRSKSR